MSDYFVHESSYIDDDVKIGKGTKIWHFCSVHCIISLMKDFYYESSFK